MSTFSTGLFRPPGTIHRPDHRVHAGHFYLAHVAPPAKRTPCPCSSTVVKQPVYPLETCSTNPLRQRGFGLVTRAASVATASAPPAYAPATDAEKTDSKAEGSPCLGFPMNLEEEYEWGDQIGKGGNGIVKIVREKNTGIQYACKLIPKVLGPEFTERKRETHLESLKREIEVLRKLRGCLNLVELRGVYEDQDNIYILQEYCKGGELVQRIGISHYSERTVASYLRAALRTLAVMHSHHVMHRDIKPENFMFLNKNPRSPLKAIDFGLAVPYSPDQLPRTDLGLEGTPWYMAPEALSQEAFPASDVWQVGVMAYQLLTGRLPFDDWKRKGGQGPDLKAIWRSILLDEVDVNSKYFISISPGAKDFVKRLLNKDHTKRPTAKEALKHPWIQGTSADRLKGEELDKSVVQRIQRFGQASEFKRLVLEHITTDMIENPFDGNAAPVCRLDEHGHPVVDVPQSLCIQALMDKFKEEDEELRDELCRNKFEEALKSMGFNLDDAEVNRLMGQLGQTGGISRHTFLASQMDWSALQKERAQDWYDRVERAFQALDTNGDGYITTQDILRNLDERLPPSELQSAVAHVMEEAGMGQNSEALDMEDFLHMLRTSSVDSLDIYDARFDMLSSHDSSASLSSQDSSTGKNRRETSTAAMLNPGLKHNLQANDQAKPAGPKVEFRFDAHAPASSEVEAPARVVFRFTADPGAQQTGDHGISAPAPVPETRVKGNNLYSSSVAGGNDGNRWF